MLYSLLDGEPDGDDMYYNYPFGPIPADDDRVKKTRKLRITENIVNLFGNSKFSIVELLEKSQHKHYRNDITGDSKDFANSSFSLVDSDFREFTNKERTKIIPFYGVDSDCYFGKGTNPYVNPKDGSVFVVMKSDKIINIKIVRNFDPQESNNKIVIRDRHQVNAKIEHINNRNFSKNNVITNITVDVSKMSDYWGFIELGSNTGKLYPNNVYSNNVASLGKVRLFFYRDSVVDNITLHPIINIRMDHEQSFVPVYKGQLFSVKIPDNLVRGNPEVSGLKFNFKKFLKNSESWQFNYTVVDSPLVNRVSLLAKNNFNSKCIIGCAIGKPFNVQYKRSMKCGDPLDHSMIDVQGIDNIELTFFSKKMPRIKFSEDHFKLVMKTHTMENCVASFGILKSMSHIVVTRPEKNLLILNPIS